MFDHTCHRIVRGLGCSDLYRIKKISIEMLLEFSTVSHIHKKMNGWQHERSVRVCLCACDVFIGAEAAEVSRMEWYNSAHRVCALSCQALKPYMAKGRLYAKRITNLKKVAVI